MEAFDGAADGYVTELGYTYRYCPEIAPSRIALACAARGLAPPQDPSPRYLELAFGQGVSINIHAAASPGEYWGIDINPEHVGNARQLAAASGSGARLHCESLEAFAARQDLPQFDMIAMHGGWSWISAENRHLAVEIVRRTLAPAGVFLVSYNCLPGWAAELPLRHLLVLHAQRAPDSQPLAQRIDASLEFAQALAEAGAKYFDAHHGVEAWLARMHGQDRSYLAHEYFNRDWHPMPSSEVARALAGAGMEFGASATLAGHDGGIGGEEKARNLLAGIDDPVMRETVLDYLSNRRFRSDIFVRRGHPRDSLPLDARLADIRFTLLQHPDYVPATVSLGGRAIELSADVHRALLARLGRQGCAPLSLRNLGRDPACAGIGAAQLAEATLVLTEAGYLHPAQTSAAIEAAMPRCRGLNAAILDRAGSSREISALACPVTGAGLIAARQELLFLRAKAIGHASPEEWARHAWDTMGEGDPASLRSDASAFAHIRLPLFESLGIA